MLASVKYVYGTKRKPTISIVLYEKYEMLEVYNVQVCFFVLIFSSFDI